MHSTKALIGGVVAGILVGAALAVLGMFVLVRSDAGQQMLRSYYTAQAQQEIIKNATTATPQGNGTSGVASSSVAVVLVPKAYATQNYYLAINGTVNAYNTIAADSEKLAPLLITIRSRASSGDFDGIVNWVIEARTTINDVQRATAQFNQGLSALQVANQTTTDATTKSLTYDLIALGGPLHSDFDQLWILLAATLDGSGPSAQVLADISAQQQKVTADSAAFSAKVKELLARFEAAVQKTQTP